MRTAYVTGGTGCLGRNLIDELLRANWRVIAAHRKTSKVSRLSGLNIELKEVDLHDYYSVRDSIPKYTDAVFHVAANVSHWPLEHEEQWKDNVLATRHLVNAALEKHVKRFVFTSTGATGPYAGTTRDEAERIELQYVRTKRLSEIEVHDGIAKGLDAVVTHPIIVIGKYDYNNYSQIFTAMDRGVRGKVLPGSIEFCHARDVAKAHISAFENGRKGERYFLGGPHASWLEVYQRIAGLLGIEPPKKQTPLWVLYAASYPLLWISYLTGREPLITPQLVSLLKPGTVLPAVEIQKSKIDLGYESAPLAKMLKDCYEWLVKEGMIASSTPSDVRTDTRMKSESIHPW